MHSTFSDGVLAPELLVEHAVMKGINLIAVTDHDTMAGSDSLRGRDLPLTVLPGVELSLNDMQGLHLLGYGLGRAEPLREKLHQLEMHRLERAHAMLERLSALGMPLDWNDVTAGCRGAVGRAHIARAMVRAGYIADTERAFKRFLGEGKPAFVPAKGLCMAQALPLLRACGFVPVLAHPMELKKNETTLRMLLSHWAEEGLMGVEAYHPTARGRQPAMLERMARSMGLLVTGGSDFHKEPAAVKDGDSHGTIGCSMAAWQTMHDDVQCLLEAVHRLRID